MPRKRPPTINDIAQQSGYSKTAVSFAFNDSSRISEQACQAIFSAADRLGYIPDPRARTFSLRLPTSIGLLLPSEGEHGLLDPYLIQIIRGIVHAATMRGYTLSLLSTADGSPSQTLRSAPVDGIITIGPGQEEIGEVVKARALAVVTIDGSPPYCDRSFVSSLADGAALQLRTVLERGHRSLVLIAEDSSPRLAAMRLGYDEVLSHYGIRWDDVAIVESERSHAGGRRAATQIVERQCRPTCIVTMSDIVALGVLSELGHRGIAVPQQISVIGFDGLEEGLFSSPALSTIECNGTQKGEAAAFALCSLIEGAEEQKGSFFIEHRLLLRSSLAHVTFS
jgi:DNA-binding LacI/PurR family transcriptional regulator